MYTLRVARRLWWWYVNAWWKAKQRCANRYQQAGVVGLFWWISLINPNLQISASMCDDINKYFTIITQIFSIINLFHPLNIELSYAIQLQYL